MARKHSPRTPTGGQLNIIGGQWRSRKLRFPDAGGVRPTPARTRETLFNWLASAMPGSHCLDLFAGSGALGLEALSRGAESAILVEQNPALARSLRLNLELLKSRNGRVVCQPVEQFLENSPTRAYDIIFMDPPFRQGWLERVLPLLVENGWITGGGHVYIEYESEKASPAVPPGWQLHRQKTAGQVTYSLFLAGTKNPA